MTSTIRTTGVLALCAVATALTVAGCGGEPPAPAPAPTPAASTAAAEEQGPTQVRPVPSGQELPSFQRALAMRGLVVGADGEQTAAYAGAICSEVGRGAPVDQLVVDIQQGTATTLNDTGYVLGAAVSSFCPQHLPKLPR